MKGTIVSSLLSFGFLLNIIWIYEPGTSLFSWHPVLMIAGQILSLQAISVFGLVSSKWRLTVHWILGGLGLVSFLLGFAAIYVNKENYSKPHFTSWHGLAGVSTVVLLICQNLGGLMAKYRISLGSYMDYKLLKKFHRISGLLNILLSITTISLVLKFLSPFWFGYFCTIIAPSSILLYRVIPKILGIKKKNSTNKSNQ